MSAVRYLLVPVLVSFVAFVAAFAGCGGAACFRNSDCSSGYGCKSGSCQLLAPAGDAGDAAAAAASATDAGDAAASQNADAG